MVNASSVTAIGTTTQYRGTTEMAVTPEGGANLVKGKKYTISFPNLWCEEDLTVAVQIDGTSVKSATVNSANSTVEFELTKNGVVTITVSPTTNKEYSFDAPIINLDYDFEGAAALLQRDLSPIALMIKDFSNNNKTPDVSCYNDLQGIINQILKADSVETADGKGAAYENIYKKYKLYEVSYKEDGSLNEFDPINNPVKKAIDSLAAEAKKHEIEYMRSMLDELKAREDSVVAANPELQTGSESIETGLLKKAIDKKIEEITKDIKDFEDNPYAPLWDKAAELIKADTAIMGKLTSGNPSLEDMIEHAIDESKFYKDTARAYVDSLIKDFKTMRDSLMDHLDAISNPAAATLKDKAANGKETGDRLKLNVKKGEETLGLKNALLNVRNAFSNGELKAKWADLKAAADSTFTSDSSFVEKFDSLGQYLLYIDSVKGASPEDSFSIDGFKNGEKFLSIPLQEKKYENVFEKFPAIQATLKKGVENACDSLKNEDLALAIDQKNTLEWNVTKLEEKFAAVIDSLEKYDSLLGPLSQVVDSFAYLNDYWKLKKDTLDQIQDSLGIAPDYQWRTELKALNDSAWKSWKPLSTDSIDKAITYQDTAYVKKLKLNTTQAQADELGANFAAIKKDIDSLFKETKTAMEIYARIDTAFDDIKDSLDLVRNAVKNTEIYNNTLEVDGKKIGGYKSVLDSLEFGKTTDPKSLYMLQKQLQEAMDARGAKSSKDSTHTELMKKLGATIEADTTALMNKIDSLNQNWESDLAKYKASADSAAKAALRQSVIDMIDSLRHDSTRIMKLGYPDPQIADLETELKNTYGKAVAELDTMIKMIFERLAALPVDSAWEEAHLPNDSANFDTLGVYAAELRELIKKMDIVKKRAERAIAEMKANKAAKVEAEEQLALVEQQLKKARQLVAAEGSRYYEGTPGACYDVWTNGENGEQEWYRSQIGGDTASAKRDSIITDSISDATCDSLYHKLIEKVDSSFNEETLKDDLVGYKTDVAALIKKIVDAMDGMRNKQANWNAYKTFQPFYTAIEAVLQAERDDIKRVETEETENNKPTALQHYLDELDAAAVDYQGMRAKDSLLEATDATGALLADSMGLRDNIYQDYREEALINSETVTRRITQCTELMRAVQELSDRAEANKQHYSASLAEDGLKELWNKVKQDIDAAAKRINEDYHFADKADIQQKIADFDARLVKIKPDELYKNGQLEDPNNNWTGKYIESRDELKNIQIELAQFITALDEAYDSLAAATNQQYIDEINAKTKETREVYKQAVKTQDEFKRLTNPTIIDALSDSIADKDRQYNDTLSGYPNKINQTSSAALDSMAAFMERMPNEPYRADGGVQHGNEIKALDDLQKEMKSLEAAYKAAMKKAVIEGVDKWINDNKDNILGDSVWADSLKLTPGSSLPVDLKIAELKDKFEKLSKLRNGYNADTIKVAVLDAAMNELINAREELDAVINEAAFNDLAGALAKAKEIIEAADANEAFKKFLKKGEVKDIITFESRPAPGFDVLKEPVSLTELWEAQKKLILTADEELDADNLIHEGYLSRGTRNNAPVALYRRIFSNAEDAFYGIAAIAQIVEEYKKQSEFFDSRSTVPVTPYINPGTSWQWGPYADLFGDFSYSMEEDNEDGELGDDEAQYDYAQAFEDDVIKKRRPVDEYFNLAGVLYDFNKNNLFTQFKENTSVYEGIKDHFADVKQQIKDALAQADQFVVKERMQLSEDMRNESLGDRDSLNDSGALYKIRSEMYRTLKNKLAELNASGLTAEQADTAQWNELARKVGVVMTLKKDSDNTIKPTLFEDELSYLQNRKSDMINLFNEISANAANISPEAHQAAKHWETEILSLYAELDSIANLDSVTVDGQKVPNSPAQLLPFQFAAAELMKNLTEAAEADGIYALEKARGEFAEVDSMVNLMAENYQQMMESQAKNWPDEFLAKVQDLFTDFKTKLNGIVSDALSDDNLLFYQDEYKDKIALAFQTLMSTEEELMQQYDQSLFAFCSRLISTIEQIQENKDEAVTALQTEFSTNMFADYANRLARIQMHLDKATELVLDLRDDGEAYYAPEDKMIGKTELQQIFYPGIFNLYNEIAKILKDAATTDLMDIADDLQEQVDDIIIDPTKLLESEYDHYSDLLEELEDDVEDFSDDVYDGVSYRSYESYKDRAEKLQERINALKQALGDALLEPTLRGDLNGDGVTDWNDFYILVNAVKTQTEPEDGDDDFDLFNLNGDDAVDVTDIILLRDYCINDEWSDYDYDEEPARSWLEKKDLLDVQTVSTENGVTRLAINLTNEQSYRAFQLDLNLDGAKLVAATLSERATGILHQSENEGHVRLFTIPSEGQGIAGNKGAVIYLDIEGAAEISGTATFASSNYKSERFDLSGTTAIDKLKNAAATAGQKVYNLGGRMMDGLKKGVNILRGEDGSAKKVIKK